jgi:hypothetical protein
MNAPVIHIEEHNSTSYAPRTYVNAHSADVTIAFAMDFHTKGEECTKKAAGDRLISVTLGMGPREAADYIVQEIERLLPSFSRKTKEDDRSIWVNIAGNGIYTLSKYGLTQEYLNAKITTILMLVSEKIFISLIRSGGQTGVDEAGLIAALCLKIPCIGLYPKGFKQRNKEGQDFVNHKDALKSRLIHDSKVLEDEGWVVVSKYHKTK